MFFRDSLHALSSLNKCRRVLNVYMGAARHSSSAEEINAGIPEGLHDRRSHYCMLIYVFEIGRLTEVVQLTRSVRVGRLTKRLVSAASMLVESRPWSEALIMIIVLKSPAIWHSISVLGSQIEWYPQPPFISLTYHMDPFDAAGNVFTILRLAARALSHFKDVEYASTEVTWFHTEASEIFNLLKDLGTRMEEDRIDTPWTVVVQAIVARTGSLDLFNDVFGLLEKRSKRGSHLEMAGERLIRNTAKEESDGILAQV